MNTSKSHYNSKTKKKANKKQKKKRKGPREEEESTYYTRQRSQSSSEEDFRDEVKKPKRHHQEKKKGKKAKKERKQERKRKFEEENEKTSEKPKKDKRARQNENFDESEEEKKPKKSKKDKQKKKKKKNREKIKSIQDSGTEEERESKSKNERRSTQSKKKTHRRNRSRMYDTEQRPNTYRDLKEKKKKNRRTKTEEDSEGGSEEERFEHEGEDQFSRERKKKKKQKKRKEGKKADFLKKNVPSIILADEESEMNSQSEEKWGKKRGKSENMKKKRKKNKKNKKEKKFEKRNSKNENDSEEEVREQKNSRPKKDQDKKSKKKGKNKGSRAGKSRSNTHFSDSDQEEVSSRHSKPKNKNKKKFPDSNPESDPESEPETNSSEEEELVDQIPLTEEDKRKILSSLKTDSEFKDLLKPFGPEKKDDLERYLREESFLFEMQTMMPRLEEIISATYREAHKSGKYGKEKLDAKIHKNLSKLARSILRKNEEKIKDFLDLLEGHELHKEQDEFKRMILERPGYDVIVYGKKIIEIRKLVNRGKMAKLQKKFNAQVKHSFVEMLEIYEILRLGELDLKVTGLFEMGLELMKNPIRRLAVPILPKIYEKLGEIEVGAMGDRLEGGNDGEIEEAVGQSKSLIGLFEANWDHFPLGYLANRENLVESMMESEWRKLLYDSAPVSLRKMKEELMRLFDMELEELKLENFNEVCLARQDSDALSWLNEENPKDKSFGGKILNLVMGNLKRSEGLKSVVSLVGHASVSKDLFPFVSSKWLAEWFLSFSDPEVRIRALGRMARCIALPLKFQDQRYFKSYGSTFYDWNFEIGELLYDSYGVANINLGTKAQIGFRSERLLNRCFVTKFDDSGKGLFSTRSIDISLDENFLTKRDFTILNVWGESKGLRTLAQISPLVNLVLVQVSEIDLKDGNFGNIIKKIKEDLYLEVILIVRESSATSSGEKFCQIKEKDIAKKMLGGELQGEEVVIINDSGQEVESGLSEFEKRLVKRVVQRVIKFRNEGDERKIKKDRFRDVLKEIKSESEKSSMVDSAWGESFLDSHTKRGDTLNTGVNRFLNKTINSDAWGYSSSNPNGQSGGTSRTDFWDKNYNQNAQGRNNQNQNIHGFNQNQNQNMSGLHQNQNSGAEENEEQEKKKSPQEYIEERNQRIEATGQALMKSKQFISKLNMLIRTRDDNLLKQLPFNKYYTHKRELIGEIRKLQYSNSLEERKRLENLEDQLNVIKHRIMDQEKTPMIELFLEILEHQYNAVILMDLANRLRHLNAKRVNGLKEEKEKLKKELAERTWSEAERSLKQGDILKLEKQIIDASLSLETLFRNILPFLENNDTWLGDTRRGEVKEKIVGLMRKGFSMELVDGESLEYKTGFLMEQLRGLGKDRACVVSILGPQSSGKSTMLNFMFGTLFHTSTGRCTSGLYVSLQRFENPNNHIKWLLIIDTEGLHSPEREDPEYDRKICSFIMTNSDIMLVTVKGEMSAKMKSDLEITLFSASQIKSFKIMPQIYFIFNQNQGNNHKEPFINQIRDMNKNIENDNEYLAKLNINKKFDIRKHFVWIFGSAFRSTKVEPIQMADQGYGNFKSVSQEFGLKVGELAGSILEYIKQPEDLENFESLGRYFRNASTRWAMIEKYADLTSVPDLKTLKNKYKLDKEAKLWRETFMKKLDETVKQKVEEWRSRFGEMITIEQLELNVKDQLNEDIRDLENMWERFKSDRDGDQSRMDLKKDLFDREMIEIKKNFDLKVQSYRLTVETRIQSRQLEIFTLTGPNYFIRRAKNLRVDHRIIQFDPVDDEMELDEVIREQFTADFTKFRDKQKEKLQLDKIATKKFEVIQRMVKNLTPFAPENLRCPERTEEVTIDWMDRNLRKFLDTDVSCFMINKVALSQLESDVMRRFGTNTRGYMNLRDDMEEKVKVRLIRDLNKAFKEEVLRKEVQEVIFGKRRSADYKVRELENLKANLRKNGVLVWMPPKNTMRNHILKSPTKLVNAIFPHNFKLKQEYGNEVDFEEIKRYFRYETKIMSPKEYSKLITNMMTHNIFLVHKVGTVGVPRTRGRDTKLVNALKLALDFSDCDNHGRLHRSLCEVVRYRLNFRKVVGDIEQICRERVFHSREQGEYDKNNIDFQSASQLSYLLLTNIVSQELEELIQDMEQDMSVCAVQIDSPLRGYLIHIALFFVWKYVVDANVLQITSKLRELDGKRDQYFALYESIVKNNKEEKMVQEMHVLIEQFIITRWQEELGNATKDLHQEIEDGGELEGFKSATIMKRLEEKYFLNAENQEFEDVYEFMTNPKEIFRREVDQMNNGTFFDRKDIKTDFIKRKILDEIQTSRLVLEKLSVKMNQNKLDNQSILNNFRLFEAGGEEVTIFGQKEKYLDLVSETAFRMIYQVIEGKEVRNVYDDPQTGMRLEMIIVPDELKLMHKTIKRDPELEGNYTETRGDTKLQPLCKNLLDILAKCETKQIFSMRDFFDKCVGVFSKAEKDYKKKKLGLADFQAENKFNKATFGAFGCPERCDFCHKKCESLVTTPHEHHTDSSGHQLRLFAGGHIEKGGRRLASLLTCDTIRGDKQIEWRGQKQTWEDAYLKSKLSEWKITIGRDVNDLQRQIDNYERVWSHYGPQICQRKEFAYENTTVRQFIEKYNKNAGNREDSHYIICLDESGSMSGSKFENAKRGTMKFLNHVIGQVGGTDCRISFFMFNGGFRNIFSFQNIETVMGMVQNTVFGSGGTSFGPVLDESINTIERNMGKIMVHRILLYTDGCAGYPQAQINGMKTLMANNPNLNFKLFWVVEGNSGGGVFARSIQDLGRDKCEAMGGVPTDNVGSTFIEIFKDDQI